ncbi:MAG: response regulator [Alkalispirochaeta sp.]
MSRILVVEDEYAGRSLVESVLSQHGYQVDACESVAAALQLFRSTRYDVILSDYFMPKMNGDELLREVRAVDRDTPFLFLTANTDVKVAVDLVKAGADDHIIKPIVGEELLFRVEKTLEDRRHRRLMRRVEQERELLELERKQLTKWRLLYAGKDITQTEQMINLLSRTINQAGGFLWVDLLNGVLEDAQSSAGTDSAAATTSADTSVTVDRELLQMVLTAGAGQKEIFDYVTFISGLDTMSLDPVVVPVGEFLSAVEGQAAEMVGSAAGSSTASDRTLRVMRSSQELTGSVRVDRRYLEQAVHEVLVNAIKFSPPDGRIVLGFAYNAESPEYLDITVSNTARATQAVDRDGQPIVGVPYDYSELVFDLFYTIEAFQTSAPDEQWGYGTGLYVVRKLLRRHGGWVSAANGVDYTRGIPETMVRITMSLPLEQEG